MAVSAHFGVVSAGDFCLALFLFMVFFCRQTTTPKSPPVNISPPMLPPSPNPTSLPPFVDFKWFKTDAFGYARVALCCLVWPLAQCTWRVKYCLSKITSGSQYLAQSLQPHHPNHPHVTSIAVHAKCLPFVQPHITSNVIPKVNIAESSVTSTSKLFDVVDSFGPDRVLTGAPPPIDPEEQSLLCLVRATLSRLCSGHQKDLQTFQHNRLKYFYIVFNFFIRLLSIIILFIKQL